MQRIFVSAVFMSFWLVMLQALLHTSMIQYTFVLLFFLPLFEEVVKFCSYRLVEWSLFHCVFVCALFSIYEFYVKLGFLVDAITPNVDFIYLFSILSPALLHFALLVNSLVLRAKGYYSGYLLFIAVFFHYLFNVLRSVTTPLFDFYVYIDSAALSLVIAHYFINRGAYETECSTSGNSNSDRTSR